MRGTLSLFFARGVGALVFACSMCFPAESISAAPDPVPESLSQMPWYNKPKDDYRHYDPSDIKLPGQSRQGPGFALPSVGISAQLVRTVLILALALAAGFVIYSLFRYFVGRRRDAAPVEAGGRVHYMAAPLEEIVRGKSNPWEEFDLALAEGRYREAAAFLYGIAVSHFQKEGVIPQSDALTARDLIRAFHLSGPNDEEVKKIFAGIARIYEGAVYAEIEPPADLLRSLRLAFPELRRP
ncbi:MAG: hypothetical protein HY042_07020 [Spirochaetia bacterium]|nr:hypothetical protein [Spirochaetia bacterium]